MNVTLTRRADPGHEIPRWPGLPIGHRAIGVVYRPEYEGRGNYVPTVLPRRYDAFLFLDTTEALHPLGDSGVPVAGEVPETFPSGV